MPQMFFAFVGAVTSFFGYVLEFIRDYLKRRIFSIPYFLSVLSINLVMLSLVSLYVYSVVSLIIKSYEFINSFIDLINNFMGSTNSYAYNFISSIRFFDALSDVFVIFSPIITLIFSIFAFKFGLRSFKFLRDFVLSLVNSRLS